MYPEQARTTRSLWDGLIGDGRPALATVGVALAFAGGLAAYLGATRQLLPHDLAYLGMSATEIDGIAEGRLMDFMVHDRVSWGGSLVAVGVMYLWLVAFPLSEGHRWAWWTLAVTGTVGFASFASHLPTGYLDSWHGIGTLLLVPVFVIGLGRVRGLVQRSGVSFPSRFAVVTIGRRLLVATGGGLAVSGSIIMAIGMTVTFVPSDIEFIGLTADHLTELNPRLVPLVSHDRIGFAGGVLVSGMLIAAIGFFGEGRAARETMLIAGLSGFGLSLWIHLLVGYTDLLHLAPSIVGPIALFAGLAAWAREYKAKTGTRVDGGEEPKGGLM